MKYYRRLLCREPCPHPSVSGPFTGINRCSRTTVRRCATDALAVSKRDVKHVATAIG